ncbi:helix-turn-helix domain-containing protein [Flavobacterium sp. MC2016-06]|jgi:AraC-like DNA-binding protein|uniref:helix-turn-helix domain-containing protein n=1 Tax=Flavobacterium sp. MC2016-06 TaxID=2676308 RepID=UPI0012BAC44B|nr:helix-turn-helix domain-containing protein [Flavobacterium sp. MC2016-06]MBU3859120.1 helix-turn-helix domain-containing protein [Flavobacterium sp. MC2016-06]
MIDILLSLFFFIAAIAGFATSLIVVFSRRNYSKSFFLGLFLLSLAIVSVYNFYLSANVFKDFPDFFSITKSFIFLSAPCSFLYVRNILAPGKKFRKYDWLHFLPFAIYFILNLLVYAGSYTNFSIVDAIALKVKNPFSILMLTIWLLYVFFQTILILNYDLKKFKGNQFHRIKVLNWIRVYNLMILFLFSALFVHYFLVRKVNVLDLSSYFLFSSVLFFTVGWLYFRPHIFHDEEESFDFVSDTTVVIKTKEVKGNLPLVNELTSDKKEEYLLKLEHVFSSKKLFLKRDFVIRDLSDETGISVHHLSNLINSEFNLHFQDYVNLKRIEYFRDKINDPEWKDLSLEGMAWGSGFKSRTTCFRAFIKHTGKSPSEYFKTIRIGSDKTNAYYFK